MKKFLLYFLAFSLLMPAVPANAAETNPSYVLSDDDLTDTNVPPGFSQQFLESRGGALAKMTFMDLDGSMKKPGDIIDYYGKAMNVNPKFLLALIQKEQSLVDDRNPSACQIDWAAGYGRPDGSTCNTVHPARGFTAQIINAAAFVECFYRDSTERCGSRRAFGYFPGRTTTIDNQPVTPANIATAAMYTYNPHLHGNALLRRIWDRWFSVGYPDGSALAASDGTVYLIQGGLKRKFASKSALATRVDKNKIIPVSDTVLASLESGADIAFADYSLVRDPATGTVYLLSGDKKRPIESMSVFRAIGFNPEEIDDVDIDDLEPYADGDPITLKSAYPTGALLQNNKTGGVYFVEDGKKMPIIDASIMKADYPTKRISVVSPETLEKYETAEPLKFKDGDLITSPGSNKAVYVVSNGQRRPIVSGEAFEQLGYSWKRIIWTTEAVMALHPVGQPVTGLPTTAGASQTALAR
ncbi:MAG: hypothetical protein QY323_00775 [Patescibacteria group bacterium]|nr:MAG: hypothetical protein QY323_00775 [Patescibacteria group bacterium]